MQNAKGKEQQAKGLSILLLFTFYFLLFTFPCCALPWDKKPLPRINTQQKIGYVNIDWWDNFSDPYLKNYIIQAIECNHDAKKASWKVEEYKQAIKLQFSQELPSLYVGGNYILNHVPDTITGTKSNLFILPFLASYEADIFLKNHDKTLSSEKTYVSSQYQEMSIYISLAADVATTYINLLKYDKQIELQEEYLAASAEELRRETASYKRGVISATELNRLEESYENAKSILNEFIKSRDKTLNQLAVLIGESPENVSNLQHGNWDSFNYNAQIPSEISSDVTFSRPDIMAAEKDLEKAKIDVKIARKEFLPSFKIYGIYSLSNIGSAGFGNWGSTVAALVANATMDLFKGGYKVANLKIYKTKYEQMFEKYRQVDLTAIKEVNDSLLIIKQDTLIDENTTKNLQIEKDNYLRAKKSYKAGVISYPRLLSEKGTFLLIEQARVNTKTTCLIDYITLYKATGGKI